MYLTVYLHYEFKVTMLKKQLSKMVAFFWDKKSGAVNIATWSIATWSIATYPSYQAHDFRHITIGGLSLIKNLWVGEHVPIPY